MAKKKDRFLSMCHSIVSLHEIRINFDSVDTNIMVQPDNGFDVEIEICS
jgi:hypothetical protein